MDIKLIIKNNLVCVFLYLFCSGTYLYILKYPLWICILASLCISLVFVMKVFCNEREFENPQKVIACKLSIYSIVLFCPVMMNANGEMSLGIPFYGLTAFYALTILSKFWRKQGAKFQDIVFPSVCFSFLLWLSNKWLVPISLGLLVGWCNYSSSENK